MILVDACNIRSGGGVVLLRYLFKRLQASATCHFLASEGVLPFTAAVTEVSRCSVLGRTRNAVLADAIRRYRPHTLFCFGNVPPAQSYHGVRVVTYFQNAHLVRSIPGPTHRLRDRFRYALLAIAIKKRVRFTSVVACQTIYVRDVFCKYYSWPPDRAPVLPFFDEAAFQSACETASINSACRDNACIYVSDHRPHKNHDILLDAWELLHREQAEVPELRVTLASDARALIERIKNLQLRGVPVRNFGALEHPEALEATARSRFVIFPSLLETLGLGLVEGSLLGCTVLASDLPYVRDVVVPSATFDPLSARSIVKCVQAAVENPMCVPSRVVVRDQMDRLLELLTSP